MGDKWQIVDTDHLDVTYASTFSVGGFTKLTATTWVTAAANVARYQFDQATSALTVVPGNLAPGVDAGPDQTLYRTAGTATLSGTVTDDGQHNPPAVTSSLWTIDSQPAGSNPPWADAYTLNTVESMCLALTVDARGVPDPARAQLAIRAKLDEWLPTILAAQEPDGYLQTRFTLGNPDEHDLPAPRWTRRGGHEGYVAGYFLEAAIAHYRLMAGRDRRMYEAARKLADCWWTHLGPAPKQPWYDGHEEIEQALVRFGRLVNEVEGSGQGDRNIQLSRFLLDCRRNGESYDQSHLPVVQQYEALGHAVRAAYCYSGVAAIAMETGDPEYHSAVKSLWDNIVNAKYYVTGGIGSGETSDGFGGNFSLPNNAYCESCADCGEVFFQHNMKPHRNTSTLYRASPDANGLTSLAVNGEPFTPEIIDGYAVLNRTWKPGDTVRFELALCVQRVKADERIAATRGRVALRCGPLIYSLESVDQELGGVLKSDAPLTAEWKPDLLGGIVVVHGQFADGSPLLAIPNYARLNRGGRSIVWLRDE